MGRIIRPQRSLLAYPSGVVPGFDPNHALSDKCTFSCIATGSNGYDLTTGSNGAVTGTPTSKLLTIGPAVSITAAGTQKLSFSKKPNTSDPDFTVGAVCVFTALNSVLPQYIFSSDISGGSGSNLSLNASNQVGIVYTSVSRITSTFVPVVNVPYLILASRNQSTANFVFVNLTTGQTTSQTVGGGSGVPTAADGTYVVGNGTNNADVTVATALYSRKYRDLQSLNLAASDPWSFWYPNAAKNAVYPYWLKSAAGGTTYTASATEAATAADAESVTAVFAASDTEAATASDADSANAIFAAADTESGTATDAESVAAVFAAADTEAATASDTNAASAIFAASATESGSASDADAASAIFAASASESGTAADSSDAALGSQTYSVTLNEAGSASDSADASIQNSIANDTHDGGPEVYKYWKGLQDKEDAKRRKREALELEAKAQPKTVKPGAVPAALASKPLPSPPVVITARIADEPVSLDARRRNEEEKILILIENEERAMMQKLLHIAKEMELSF